MTFQRDFHTPGTDTCQPSFKAHDPCYHPSPVVRMAAAHERQTQMQRDVGAQAPVVVVGGGSSKLPLWLPGEEKDNRGFYWSTKQFIQNAWRQYMMAEGIHAPRTFKSLISPQLVPAICAETEIPLGDWEHLSDRVLLERIEDRLKPKNATDVINRLRELKISKDTSKGTLSQRYRVYAETFMQRLAEAIECGCTVPEPAIKQAFTSALKQEPAIDSWVHEVKWSTVWDAHRRIVTRLRDYDAWAVYDGMQKNLHMHHVRVDVDQSAARQDFSDSSGKRDRDWERNRDRSAEGRRERDRSWEGRRASEQHSSFIHALSSALQNVASSNYGAQQGKRAPSTYQHPGLDDRGPHWHRETKFIRCREPNCSAKFCQICGMHGHGAEDCFKRERQTPGINLHGYYQDNKPDSWPVRSEDTERRQSPLPAATSAPQHSHAPQYTHAPPPARSEVRFSNVASGTHQEEQQRPSSTAQRSSHVHSERQGNVNAANGAGSANLQEQDE